MPSKPLTWSLAAAIAMTILATVVHGRFTNRWGTADKQRAAAAQRLGQAPTAFGEWERMEEITLEDRVLGILNCNGHWFRRYIHRTTGQVVAVVMIVGPPGPTSTHIPELCYSTQGFTQTGDGERLVIEGAGGAHEFRRLRFDGDGLARDEQEVCYSWRQGDRWTVPPLPRMAFGGGPYLFKMQLAAEYTAAQASSADEKGCEAFLRDFLPALDQTVFAPPTRSVPD